MQHDYHSVPIFAPGPYTLRGGHVSAFLNCIIDPMHSLLGRHYLNRMSGMFWIAPSGQGKSTAAMQSSVCWACGRAGFDIKPNFRLRITMIQAEDDKSDLANQIQVVDWLGLSKSERETVEENLWIETVNDKVGLDAIRVFDEILSQQPCDLWILNPYTAYLGADSKDEEANSIFLRSHIQALLNKHNCAILIFHHTPKTNFRSNTEKWSATDWMYSGSGTSILTNWARAIIAMDPLGDSGVYKFIAAKRHQRIGWADRIAYFRHDERPGVMLWSPADETAIEKAAQAKTAKISDEDLLAKIPPLDGISTMALRTELEKQLTQRNAKILIDNAIDRGIIVANWIQGPRHAGRVKMLYRCADSIL